MFPTTKQENAYNALKVRYSLPSRVVLPTSNNGVYLRIIRACKQWVYNNSQSIKSAGSIHTVVRDKSLIMAANRRVDMLRFVIMDRVVQFIKSRSILEILKIFPDIRHVIKNTGTNSFLNALSRAKVKLVLRNSIVPGFYRLPDQMLADGLFITIRLLYGKVISDIRFPTLEQLVSKLNMQANAGLTDVRSQLVQKRVIVLEILDFLLEWLRNPDALRCITVFRYPVLIFTRLQIKTTIKTRLVFAVNALISICQIFMWFPIFNFSKSFSSSTSMSGKTQRGLHTRSQCLENKKRFKYSFDASDFDQSLHGFLIALPFFS